jgi:hypothetical protein
VALIEQTHERASKVVVVMMTGRPIEITEQLRLADAWWRRGCPVLKATAWPTCSLATMSSRANVPFTWQRN